MIGQTLLALVASALAVGLSGCLQLLAVAAAGDAAGQAASALGKSMAAGDGSSTLADIDRLLREVPGDSPQHQDLQQLREQVAASSHVGAGADPSHFASDPRREADADHRHEIAAAAEERGRQQHAGVLEIGRPQTSPDLGHSLVLDPPRRLGFDEVDRRDVAKPFHVPRSNDLEPAQPRFYGTSMPALPERPDPRGRD